MPGPTDGGILPTGTLSTIAFFGVCQAVYVMTASFYFEPVAREVGPAGRDHAAAVAFGKVRRKSASWYTGTLAKAWWSNAKQARTTIRRQ